MFVVVFVFVFFALLFVVFAQKGSSVGWCIRKKSRNKENNSFATGFLFVPLHMYVYVCSLLRSTVKTVITITTTIRLFFFMFQ